METNGLALPSGTFTAAELREIIRGTIGEWACMYHAWSGHQVDPAFRSSLANDIGSELGIPEPSASGLKPPVETQSGSMRSTKAAVPKGQAPTPTPTSAINQGEAEILREAERARYQWAANELLACDYGDNDRGEVGWHVYGWRSRNGERRIYGPSIDAAIDAEIALTAQGGEG